MPETPAQFVTKFEAQNEFEPVAKQVLDSLASYPVVCIKRTEPLTCAQQVTLTRLLGKPGQVPNVPPREGLRFHQDFHEGYFPYWHCDIAPQKFPHLYSIVHCVVAPHEGGNTPYMLLSEVEAILSASLKQRIVESFSLESSSLLRVGYFLDPRDQTQRLALNCNSIPRIREGNSKDAPEQLRSLAIELHDALDAIWDGRDPSVCYLHKWSAGDIVIYDNLKVCHSSPVFDGMNANRWLRRTTVETEWESFDLLVP